MRFHLVVAFVCTFLFACAAAWPFPKSGPEAPSSVFVETRWVSNAERLQRGMPLLKPTKRRPGAPVAPCASSSPDRRAQIQKRLAEERDGL
ncbi:unnamed protein product [Mycena citricolor]|uniref:Secreted protein n=1 Tax=Mycena citricolor TaxID=2018698 RepID=A0AAD2GX81_9AGAR|nr:unnamed protein product [Mycena citricolor]